MYHKNNENEVQIILPPTHKHAGDEPNGTLVYVPTFVHRIEMAAHKGLSAGMWTGKHLIAPVIRGVVYVGSSLVLFIVGLVVVSIVEAFKRKPAIEEPEETTKIGNQYVFNNCNINNLHING
jgi:hypothetical protein